MSSVSLDLTTIETILRRLHREVGGHPTLELLLSDTRVDWESLGGDRRPVRIPLASGGAVCLRWLPETGSVRLHLERYDRQRDPVGHFASDTAAPVGAAIGALIGGLMFKRGGALAGALIGGVAASNRPPRSSGTWAVSSWSEGGYWEVCPTVRNPSPTVAA